jgi:hypothetical protein
LECFGFSSEITRIYTHTKASQSENRGSIHHVKGGRLGEDEFAGLDARNGCIVMVKYMVCMSRAVRGGGHVSFRGCGIR